MLLLAGGFPRKLYTVDRTTGVATEVGDLAHSIASLAFDGETLFGVTGNTLYSVDPATAALTRIASLRNFGRNESQARGIVWDGTHLLMSGDSRNRLYRVDRSTGQATDIAGFNGLSSVRYGDLAWDGTTLFMLDTLSDRLLTVDRTTAEMERVGSSTSFGVGETGPRGMAWDGEKLFLVGSELDALIDLDRTTSVGAVVGMATQFGQGISVPNGIAWAPPSAPEVIVPPILPEPQFEGFDEFTLYFDILRPPANNPTVVASNVEMLVQTEIESAFISDTASLEFALGTFTYTPRFPIEGVLSGDRIAIASEDPVTAIPNTTPIIKGGRTVGDNFRQSFVVTK